MALPPEVALAYPGIEVDPAPYGTGLINLTMRGRIGDVEVVVQRVHPAFAASVHEDIEAVTAHVERRGLRTPRLVRTKAGELSALDQEGRPWRALSFVPGRSLDRIRAPGHAEEAGALVGRFHAALADLEHDYVHLRKGVHDVPFRRCALETAIESSRSHRLHAEVARVAENVLASDADMLPLDVTSHRHAHGDLKISNLLFDESGAGVALVDLDTLAKMPWPFELGDALRSWCNPSGEDVEAPRVDEAIFEAALRGWARGAGGGVRLDPLEAELVARGVFTIASELAMRFLTDALEESYFGWDPLRFPARGEHNLARARGQWSLARSILDAMSRLEATARRTLRA